MREEATAVTAPQVMTTPEASAYIAGKPAGTAVRTEEFLRFAERFGLEPIDKVGGGSRVRGETCIRYKWSKRHIDLVLMTGMKFRDALKWAQGAKLILS